MFDWRKQAERIKSQNPFVELADVKELNHEDQKFLLGNHNKGIRWYFYLENGVAVLNNFRNLFLGILGIYIALKLTNPIWMIIMLLPCIIILSIIGWYSVHHLNKVKEWLSMRFSTSYGIRAFNFNEEQVKLLKEIKELLANKK